MTNEEQCKENKANLKSISKEIDALYKNICNSIEKETIEVSYLATSLRKKIAELKERVDDVVGSLNVKEVVYTLDDRFIDQFVYEYKRLNNEFSELSQEYKNNQI